MVPMHHLKRKRYRKMKNFHLACLAIIISCTAQAQERERCLTLSAGGGLHQLHYQLDNGSSKGGFGFNLKADYTIFFNKTWGVSSGIGMKSYETNGTLSHTRTTPDVDVEGDSYEFRTYYMGWKENQKALLVDIPLMVAFRHTLTPNFGLMANLGVMLSIPLSATYTATGGTIATTGYYSKWNVELSDIPEQGFRTYTSRPVGDLSLRPSLSLSTSLGSTYQLMESISLYAGIYASYGLNRILKSDSQVCFQKDGIYNSILTSDECGKVRLFALGAMLGVHWNLTK